MERVGCGVGACLVAAALLTGASAGAATPRAARAASAAGSGPAAAPAGTPSAASSASNPSVAERDGQLRAGDLVLPPPTSTIHWSRMSDGRLVISDRPEPDAIEHGVQSFPGASSPDALERARRERAYWHAQSEAFAARQRDREAAIDEARRWQALRSTAVPVGPAADPAWAVAGYRWTAGPAYYRPPRSAPMFAPAITGSTVAQPAPVGEPNRPAPSRPARGGAYFVPR